MSVFQDRTSENVMLETTENLRSGDTEPTPLPAEPTPLPAEPEPLCDTQSPVQEVGTLLPAENKNDFFPRPPENKTPPLDMRAALENKIVSDRPTYKQ